MLPIDINVRVDEYAPGDWRVFSSPRLVPPAGRISETSYPSQEEALKALRAGEYD